MKRNWLLYDILTVVKNIFGFVLVFGPVVLFIGYAMPNKPNFIYVMGFVIVWAVICTFVILPKLRHKTLWKGEGKFKDYRLIRTIGKFCLIKSGEFMSFQEIEDSDKDGIPDKKVEIHFMGRSGYATSPRELEDIDCQAFTEAMKSID